MRNYCKRLGIPYKNSLGVSIPDINLVDATRIVSLIKEDDLKLFALVKSIFYGVRSRNKKQLVGDLYYLTNSYDPLDVSEIYLSIREILNGLDRSFLIYCLEKSDLSVFTVGDRDFYLLDY